MALELILPEFSTHAFIPLVAATVVGVVVVGASLLVSVLAPGLIRAR